MIFCLLKILPKVRYGRKEYLNLRSICRVDLIFLLINFLAIYAQSDGNTSKCGLSICFISDTQVPTIFERLFLKYNKNAYARKLILEKITQDTCVAVFLLGDIVASGYFENWTEIDTFVYKLEEHGVNFIPIHGNHEHLPASELIISNFIKRYGKEKKLGYSKKFSILGVIILNSNFDELSDEKKSMQMRTYRESLRNY